MLLELAGAGALDRPVARVVRPHGELVDQDAVGGLEQLDGEHADHAEPVGDPDGELLGGGRQLVGEARRGREHLVADAVALHRLDDRPDGDLAERRARHLGGELAHASRTRSSTSSVPCRSSRSAASSGPSTTKTPLPS